MTGATDTYRTKAFGDDYAVFEGSDRITDQMTYLQAQATVGRLTKQADQAARTKIRPCLCCKSSFASEGPHNRLCDRCRGSVAGLDRQMVG